MARLSSALEFRNDGGNEQIDRISAAEMCVSTIGRLPSTCCEYSIDANLDLYQALSTRYDSLPNSSDDS